MRTPPEVSASLVPSPEPLTPAQPRLVRVILDNNTPMPQHVRLQLGHELALYSLLDAEEFVLPPFGHRYATITVTVGYDRPLANPHCPLSVNVLSADGTRRLHHDVQHYAVWPYRKIAVERSLYGRADSDDRIAMAILPITAEGNATVPIRLVLASSKLRPAPGWPDSAQVIPDEPGGITVPLALPAAPFVRSRRLAGAVQVHQRGAPPQEIRIAVDQAPRLARSSVLTLSALAVLLVLGLAGSLWLITPKTSDSAGSGPSSDSRSTPSRSPVPAFPGELRKGSPDTVDVKVLQTQLNRIGCDHAPAGALVVDGVFGAKTESAVRSFQRTVNLPETGVVAEPDWTRLYQQKPIADPWCDTQG
ncbi:MAG: peptidoglycan-binding protein [Mycobacteriales bacterium]